MSTLSYRPTSNGTGGNIAFSIDSFSESEIEVYVDGVKRTNGGSNNFDYDINPYSATGGTIVWNTSGSNAAPTSSNKVRIQRRTKVLNNAGNTVEGKATYSAGSAVKATDLNNNTKQALRAIQEKQDQLIQTYDIEAGAVTSDKILDGTIVEADIANGAVTANKIAANAVTPTEILNGSVTADKIATDAVTSVKIQANAVTDGKIAPAAVSANKIATDAVTSVKIQAGAVTDGKIAAAAVTANKIATDAVTSVKIQANAVTDGKIAASAVTENKIANNAVTIDKIADAAIVTNSEQASHSVDDNTFFTTAAAEARYFNASTGETIKNGQTFPDNDTTIATTAAINDRIIDLVDDVGGFVPIANETSFPTTNPDINLSGSAKGGTIVSVAAASTALTAQSGTTLTIANGRGTGNAVIITGVTATIPQGFGFLVETTATDHTYAFHRLVPKATEVTTVAGKATEIGRLGTAAAVEDMSILGTTDVVADMAILGTTDVVADMNTLGTADVVADMNTLAVTSVVNNMDTVAGAVTNVNNVGGSIANVNTVAGSISNVNAVAGNASNVNAVGGSITNVNSVGGSIANVNTVASNLASVNNFANVYRTGTQNPQTSLDVGDLFFNQTSNSLKVYTGSAWVDGVTTTGNFALKTGNTFTGSNVHNDNVKSIYGTASDGLEIFHSGSNSFISDTGTGDLIFTGTVIRPRTDQFTVTNAAANEVMIQSVANGAASLYFDGTKRIETTSNGVSVAGNGVFTGNIQVNDNAHVYVGNSGDLDLFHNGQDSFIRNTAGVLKIQTNTENAATFTFNGGVELYHNNTKMLETTADGATLQKGLTVTGVEGGVAQIRLEADEADNASDRFRLVATDSAGFEIQSYDGSQYDTLIKGLMNDSVELYFNNSKKLHTASTGVHVTGQLSSSDTISTTGNLDMSDSTSTGNNRIRLGTGDDFELYHNGTDSFISNSTGGLKILGDTIRLKGKSVDENLVVASANGAVELYNNGTKMLSTESRGAIVQKSGDVTFTVGSTNAGGVRLCLDGDSNGDSSGNDYAFLQHTTDGDLLISADNPAQNAELIFASGNSNTRAKFEATGHFRPTSNGVLSCGTSSFKWSAVHATNFYGNGSNLTGINTDLVSDTSPQLGGDLDTNGHHMVLDQDHYLYFVTNGGSSFLGKTSSGLFLQNNGNLFIRGDDVYVRGTDNANLARFNEGGSVDLYHNGSKKFETTSAGAYVTGNFTATASSFINGTLNCQADDDTRLRLNVPSNNSDDWNYIAFYGRDGNRDGFMGTWSDGTVTIYSDASGGHFIKFHSGSIEFNNHLLPNGNNSKDLGSNGSRWRNIYTNDLNLSNEGSSNDIDGSWGDWTIQEGESDLFLKNNRSGKKFKFNLTEVS